MDDPNPPKLLPLAFKSRLVASPKPKTLNLQLRGSCARLSPLSSQHSLLSSIAMEFWGLEVQPGKTVKVNPGENKYLHLSQASLGEIKDKGNDRVPIFVKFDNRKLVLGTLSAGNCAQIQYDLLFEKEFELSHGSKNTSIYFIGYKTEAQGDYDFMSDELDSQSESDEEDIQLVQNVKGKSEVKDEKPKLFGGKPNAQKSDATVNKPKPKIEEPKEDEKQKTNEDEDEDDDDDDDDDESEEDESGDDEDMLDGEDDSNEEDEDDSSDDEEEATPKQVETGKKRPAGSALKTPGQEKKAKLISPAGNQKTGGGGKKTGHIATPYPAKKGKSPANTNNSKKKGPKSAGIFS
ncbi:Histone deacetylase [Musa troglodytarum]|nr:Histone deacetylase [Musa troglodytarum]